MPNVVTAIRDEINRLARRVIKAETAVLRKASAQYRRDIARLKRELTEADRRIARLESTTKKKREVAIKATEGETNGKRFSAKGLRSHRRKLGVSAAQYGQLVGVSGQTVYLWEQGRSRPRAKAFAQWRELRGLGKREALARLDERA